MFAGNLNESMRHMRRRWELKPIACEKTLRRLQSELNDLPEALARSLLLRGVDTFEHARAFFRPSQEQLLDPFLMADMEPAADRVAEAVTQGERVLVYGDYDVDGTTATALMTLFLRKLGLEVDYFVPDRFQDGYGLKVRGIDTAVERGATLIIALDCGITAIDEAAYARDRGIDLIICDHHTPKNVLPDALAVIDPKRVDCAYPFKELSGCGIGFKLACAVLKRLERPIDDALEYLDLVAVSTASDIVPMVGENRMLMIEGLKRLRSNPRLGLALLADKAAVDLTRASTSEIVFGIGPRINAAGRMCHASLAVDLLTTDDATEAARMALEIERINAQRRTEDKETEASALRAADEQIAAGFEHSLVLFDEDWHAGVIGIVASRMVERFHRPSILLTHVQGEAKGSARSIAGLNVFDALTACSDLLHQFGGHYFAAGLSLDVAAIPAFRERFDAIVRERLDPDDLLPAIDVDARLSLCDIDDRFWAVLKQFEPFGPENLKPIFHAPRLGVCGPPKLLGGEGKHLRFAVRDIDSEARPCEVIAFSMGDRYEEVNRSRLQGVPLELLFSIEENHWRGETRIQYRARDLRLAEST
jgi:single-stranded-DNA-specific exonuclease